MSAAQLPEGLDPAEIYKKWWDLPNTKTGLVPGESMWAKEIAPGVIGLNNNPLHEDFAWQDILVGRTVVHRRWHNKIYYTFETLTDKEEDAARRKTLADGLASDERYPGFWSDGLGYVLFEEEDTEKCKATLSGLLEGFDFPAALYEEEDEE